MSFVRFFLCSLLVLLAACDTVGLRSRNADMSVSGAFVSLGPGKTAEVTVTICPGIIDLFGGGRLFREGGSPAGHLRPAQRRERVEAYGSQPRLLVPLLAPPSGGPTPVVLRRYAP